jgi:Tfp pilus assembly protein PilE
VIPRQLSRCRHNRHRPAERSRGGFWTRGRLAARSRRVGLRLGDERGFTVVEVMVASIVLVVGLGALMGMLMTSSHVIKTTRIRQEETSVAREILEDARGLAYTQLNTAAITGAVQPAVPQSSISGGNLIVTRALAPSTGGNYAFIVSLTACSLDSPSDGYGNHNSPPASGGSWCPDVAPNGTADSQPDDYKRVSVTVTPSGQSTPTIQQTILIYQRAANGPAISCLSTTSTCPGSSLQVTSGTSQTFNVTTTSTGSTIQWLVNGNPPPSNQIGGGGTDPYSPSGTTSTFTWVYPTTTVNGTTYTIDGTYTITAVAYDANGNSGTRSTLQVKVNEHTVLPPAAVTAGWNDLMGGVDIQWLPSVDQDVSYYQVWHKYGTQAPILVTCRQSDGTVTTNVAVGSSCADDPLDDPLGLSPGPPASRPTCTAPPTGPQSYTTTNYYYVVGYDTDPTTGLPRQSTFSSPLSDANLCNHPPYAPAGLTATSSGGQITLSWTAPSPADPDAGDSVQAWRIYRWPVTGTMSDPPSRYQLVGTTTGSPVTSYTDTSPDPGGVIQHYCVTAVDTHSDESPCSGMVTG